MPPRGGEPGVGSDTAAAVPKAAVPGRDGLLADIRGGSKLKKVSDAEKRDRSAAAVPGSEPAAPPPGAPAGGGGDAAQGGLAGALASALAARKSKVSHSGEFCSFSLSLLFPPRYDANNLLQMMRKTMMIGKGRRSLASHLTWWPLDYAYNTLDICCKTCGYFPQYLFLTLDSAVAFISEVV